MTLTLVSTVNASSYGTPGPVQLAPANNQGDMLLVVAAWDVAAPADQVSGGSPIVPCAAVADSQNNRWRAIADSGNEVAGARCAVWLCTNSLALGTHDWLSVCPQGNYTSLFAMCAVFNGVSASYWPVIDFTMSTNSQSSTALALTQTTGPADFCFAVGATGDTAVTLSSAGAGWTSIGTGSVGGSNPDGLKISADYQIVNASTAVTASYTLTGARSLAMCMVGVSQASALPQQQKADFPLVVTEAAFGATIGDPSQALLDNEWTDISQYAIGPDGTPVISATRGRQYELDQPESGTLSVTCNNLTGVFNPQNTSSPFYSNAVNSNMSFQSGVLPWTGQNSTTIQPSSVASFASSDAAVVSQSMLMSPPANVSATPVVRASGNSAGTVTSFGVTLASNATGGHLVVGVGLSNTGAIIGISDTKGNTYNLVAQAAQPRPMWVFDAAVTVPLTTSDTITVTATVSSVINIIAVHETNISAVVLPMTAEGNSTTASCTSGYLAGLPAQVLAFGNISTSSPTWSSPMTSLTTVSGGGGPFFTAAYETVTSASGLGNFTPTATWSGAHTWSMAVVQLLPSLSGSGTFGAVSEQTAISPVKNYSASAYVMVPAGISSGTGVFGSSQDTTAMGVATWASAVSAWNSLTAIPLAAARWYKASGDFTYDTTLQGMVAAGVKICLSLQPGFNPLSAADLASMETLLATLQGAGANVNVTLWHEPFFNSLSAAQYTSMIRYYGPTVRGYYPLWSVFSGSDTSESAGYYPGDAFIDGVAIDVYAGPGSTAVANAQSTVIACQTMADNHRKPFGVWEFNSAWDLGIIPLPQGQSQPGAIVFFQWLQALFQARIVAGKPVGDILYFNSHGGSTGSYNFLTTALTANGGFESTIGNWSAGNLVTLSQTTAQAHSGTGSMQMLCTGGGTSTANSCAGGSITSQGLPCVAGQLIGASAWFRTQTTTRAVRVSIQYFTSGGVSISTTAGTTVNDTNTGWTQATLTDTAPATTAFARLITSITGPPAASEIHYVDDPEIGIIPTSNDLTAPVQYPWDWRLSFISAIQLVLATTPPAVEISVSWYTSGHSLIGTVVSAYPYAIVPGTWTQISLNNISPPGNAAYAQIGVNTANSFAGVVYVAEAGIAPSPDAVQGGLVRLGTPIRVTAFWNGRSYPVAWGLIERWPQSWPDFPQWGWSNLVATDIAGAAGVTTPSALRGQILLDQPYASFPLSEQYTASANTVNGVVKTTSECDGQVATNIVITNQRPAVYSDGNHAVETGLSMGFLGDNGTGIGVTTYNTFDLSGDRGPGVQYGPDLTLPSLAAGGTGNLSFEVWTTIPDNVTLPGSTFTAQLWEIMVEPDLESNGANNLAQGVLLTGGIYYTTTGISAYWQPNWIASTIYTAGTLVPGELCQIGFVLQDGNLYTMLNGSLSGAIAGAPTTVPLYALAFGLSTSVTGSRGQFDGNYNYSIAYPTLYSYRLSPSQVVSHWNAGTTGFSGDSTLQRAARYVAWSQVNVGLAGPVITETPLLGPAYDSAGSQMNAAIQADSVSAGSRWGGVASGNLVILPRTTLYNRPSTITFGDSPAGALNVNYTLNAGVAGWAGGNGASVSVTTASPGGFGKRALAVVPNGVTANPFVSASGSFSSSHIPVSTSLSYVIGAWIQPSVTYASGAIIAIDWYTSGNVLISTTAGANSQSLPSGTWAYLEVVTGLPPATASYGIAYVQVAGTPPSSTTFYVTQFTVLSASDQVPYEPTMALDYDNSYVNNSAQATLTNGPNTLASPIVVDSASVVKYLQRGPLSQQVSGQTTEDAYDRATWSLGKFSEPSVRVSGMSVNVAAYPLAFTQVLKTDIGDTATVTRNPIGNQGYTLPVAIEQVNLEISGDRWSTSYQQSPNVPENAVLYVDDSSTSDSTLGNGTLPW